MARFIAFLFCDSGIQRWSTRAIDVPIIFPRKDFGVLPAMSIVETRWNLPHDLPASFLPPFTSLLNRFLCSLWRTSGKTARISKSPTGLSSSTTRCVSATALYGAEYRSQVLRLCFAHLAWLPCEKSSACLLSNSLRQSEASFIVSQ